MLSIALSTRAVAIVTLAIALTAALALLASDAFGSADTPDQVVLGDINCDGLVDQIDALGALRYKLGFEVEQQQPCFDVGSVAAIPGPSGIPGPRGPAAISLFANVLADGSLLGGSATGAVRISAGRYTVTFDTDVSHCAPIANAGITGSLGTFGSLAVAKTFVGGVSFDANQVSVTFHQPTAAGDPDPMDNDFHLIVAC